MIDFPTSLDSLTNPAATDYLGTAATVGVAALLTNLNDAVEAIEAKVGINSSAVTTSHDYKLSGVTSTDKAVSKTGTETLTNKTLTSPVINVTSDAQGDVYYRNGSGLFARLAAGTSGKYLKTQGAGANPTWDTPTASTDGWTSVSDTWTFASATTITVPSGAASLYQKGDKIKITQTTAKYFYITTVADALLTVTGGSDYSVANAAITSPNYSKASNPQGFPISFNWTPVWTSSGGAFTNDPTTNSATFFIIGNLFFYRVHFTYNATSGGSGTTDITNTNRLTVAQQTAGTGWSLTNGWALAVHTDATFIYTQKYDASTSIANSAACAIAGFYPF